MRWRIYWVAAFVLACPGCQKPCEGFCELECENEIVCISDQTHPTGDRLDACVNACLEFVGDAECICRTDEECAVSPLTRFSNQYSC
jgi:hypothetical protein